MLEIDPQLRGQADVQQEEAQDAPVATESYVYPKTQASPDAAVTESERVALALTSQDLPYYEAQLSNLANDTTPTYSPIHFVAHEARKRPRSCESCRGLKVKCEPNESGVGPCKRCAKAGRECLYTESSGRRKKKEDNKVKELEQKVNGLTAALLAQRGAAASESLVYGDDSLLLNGTPDSNGLTRKRRHSEVDEDGDTGSPTKHKTRAISDVREVVHNFCASLKTLEAWMKQYSSHPDTDVKSSSNSQLTNGTSKSNGKSAPTAQMARTPLDLLSQVASNEQSTPAKSAQSEWYSPYANTTKLEDSATDGISEMESLIKLEVGDSADMVLSFLTSFVAKSPAKHDIEGE